MSTDQTNEQQIRSLLATYERALNTSDAALAASCFTSDGIFMPTTLPTASAAGIEPAYAQIFGAIRLNVTFTIDELEVLSNNTAYAMTRSNGTQTILADNSKSAESNREVFLFHTEDDQWKIARYMFNKAD